MLTGNETDVASVLMLSLYSISAQSWMCKHARITQNNSKLNVLWYSNLQNPCMIF